MEFLNCNKEVKNLSGIYQITCLINQKIYIGSTKNFRSRFRAHRRDLEIGGHHSIHLQRAWAKYGKENFTFEILQIVNEKELIKVEQKFLDTFIPWEKSVGFNISRYADMRLAHKDRPKSKLSRQRLSEAIRGKPRNIDRSPEALNRRSVLASAAFGIEFSIQSPDGIIFSGKGIKPFCRQHNLPEGAIRDVIYGNQKHYNGWKLPGEETHYYQFINPQGETIKIDKYGKNCLTVFCKENGLLFVSMHNLWRGITKYSNGYTRYDVLDYHYKITSNEGKEFIVCYGQFTEFAKKHGLNNKHLLRDLLSSKLAGWKITQLFTNE